MKRTMVIFSVFFLAGGIFVNNLFAQENDLKEMKEKMKLLEEKLNRIEEKLDQGTPQRSHGGNPMLHEYDPFQEIQRLQEEMDNMSEPLFGNSPSGNAGVSGLGMNNFSQDNFNIEETKDGYVIKLDTTGLNKDKIDIEINKHSLTLKTESSKSTEDKSANGYFKSESYGQSVRTIPLPTDADTEKLTTEQSGETFLIKMPKKL